jgi:hypothetical protein
MYNGDEIILCHVTLSFSLASVVVKVFRSEFLITELGSVSVVVTALPASNITEFCYLLV